MRIPESFIQEVLLRNPLEELVSQYATLKRAGSNMVCCCPFHNEKTPSFTLYSEPSHYYCYGCGAGGDAITFIRQIENLDYVSAVEYLAHRAGLTMPVKDDLTPRVNKKRYYEMNAEAARFWHKTLSLPEGERGRQYLKQRGLSDAVIRHFGIGYAPDAWDGLYRHLKNAGYTDKEMDEAFLCKRAKSGTMYDIFRGRAMFPVIDPAGNVVAFSGRFAGKEGENDRKYVNSADTPVYKKSRTVFALNFAKNSPEKELILCEGNLDVVSLHAAGVTNAVASLGTALTADQCRLLKRYTDRVCLCYDADDAGKRAAQKAIRLLQEVGIRVRVLSLTGTADHPVKDPDDFIRAFGKGAFDERFRAAPGAIEYQFQCLREKNELETLDGKNAFIQDCAALLAGVPSEVERELFIGRIAEVCTVPESVIRAQIRGKAKKEMHREEKKRVEEALQKTRGIGNRTNPDKAKFLSRAGKEENITGILLLREEYLLDPAIRIRLVPENFRCDLNRRALEVFLRLTESGEIFPFSALNESFSPEEIGELARMREMRRALKVNTPAVLKEMLDRLEEEQQKSDIQNEPLSTAWLEKLKAQKERKESES